MSRPELTGHASLFYNNKEARKYDSSSRMIGVQREITERAIELLRLDSSKPSFVLDVGCGSGLSGKVLEEHGHVWVGCDVSRDMLEVANERIERKRLDAQNYALQSQLNEGQIIDNEMKENSDDDNDDNDDDDKEEEGEKEASGGDLMHHDMGTGLPFRAATFDGCISISTLQWLCYSNSKGQVPKRTLMRFFSSLYQVLRRGARAVLQFYPETAEQAILTSECAAKVGFAGGIVVDYPNSTKAKKHYLVLSFDRASKPPKGLTGAAATEEGSLMQQQDDMDDNINHPNKKKTSVRVDKMQSEKSKRVRKKKGGGKSKDWILQKKNMQRKKGKDVRPDTKYTARKRPMRF